MYLQFPGDNIKVKTRDTEMSGILSRSLRNTFVFHI